MKIKIEYKNKDISGVAEFNEYYNKNSYKRADPYHMSYPRSSKVSNTDKEVKEFIKNLNKQKINYKISYVND